jgi:hypothetical protein
MEQMAPVQLVLCLKSKQRAVKAAPCLIGAFSLGFAIVSAFPCDGEKTRACKCEYWGIDPKFIDRAIGNVLIDHKPELMGYHSNRYESESGNESPFSQSSKTA